MFNFNFFKTKKGAPGETFSKGSVNLEIKQLFDEESKAKMFDIVDGQEPKDPSYLNNKEAFSTVDTCTAKLPQEAKDIQNNVQAEAQLETFKKFLEAYMSNTAGLDINYRLGSLKGVKTSLNNNMYLSPSKEGNSYYTRTLLTNKFVLYNTLTEVNLNAYTTYNYVPLLFPPYKNLEGSFTSKISPKKPVDVPYDVNNFRVWKDGEFTFRELGWKAVTEYIDILQFLLQKITGIVSTCLTEWDMSIYFQEGLAKIINDKDNHKVKIPHLRYGITEDNPTGLTGDDAYTYGVVNAAVSKFSNEAIWHPEKYPQSSIWTPNTIGASKHSLDAHFADKSMYANPKSNPVNVGYSYLTYFESLKTFDDWCAQFSGWADWELPFWKALYGDSGEGLGAQDILLFDPDKTSPTHGAGRTQNSEGGSSGKNNGSVDSDGDVSVSSFNSSSTTVYIKQAQKQVDEKDWLDASGEKPSTSLSYGMCSKSPAFYGGPHGSALDPYSPQAYFQWDNSLLKNTYLWYYNKGGRDLDPNRSNHLMKKLYEGERNNCNDLSMPLDNVNYTPTPGIYRAPHYDFESISAKTKLKRADEGYHIKFKRNVYKQETITEYIYQFRNYDVTSSYYDRKYLKPGSVAYAHTVKGFDPKNYSWGWLDDIYSPWSRIGLFKDFKITRIKNTLLTENEEASIYTSFPFFKWQINPIYAESGCVSHGDSQSNWNTIKRQLDLGYNRQDLISKDEKLNNIRLALNITNDDGKPEEIREGSDYYGWFRWFSNTKLLNSIRNGSNGDWTTLYLFVNNGSGVQDALISLNVRQNSFTRVVQRSHEHSCHSCHTHRSSLQGEYAEVDLGSLKFIDYYLSSPYREINNNTSIEQNVFYCGEKIGENSYKDLRKNLNYIANPAAFKTAAALENAQQQVRNNASEQLTRAWDKNARIAKEYIGFSVVANNTTKTTNGILKGTGVFRCLPGFNSGLYAQHDIPKNQVFGNLSIAYGTEEGFISSSTINGKQYCYTLNQPYFKIGGYFDSNYINLFKTLYTTVPYECSDGVIRRMSILNAPKLTYLTLANQKQHLKEVYDVYDLIDTDKINYFNKIIGPDIKDASQKKDSTHKCNPFYGDILNLKSLDVPTLKNSLLEEIDKINKWLNNSNYKTLVYNMRDNLSWEQLNKGLEVWQEIADYYLVGQMPLGVATLNNYLHMLYETRQYFNNKRFNKVDGSYWLLRGLEQLSIITAKTLNTTTPDTNMEDTKTKMYTVHIDINNTTEDKLKALVNNVPLDEDKIIRLYFKVEYPDVEITTKEQAKKWEQEHEGIKLTPTVLFNKPTHPLYDPKKCFAIQPKNTLYQVKGMDWDENENLKESLKEHPNVLLQAKVKDFGEEYLQTIVWEDSNDRVSIVRGNFIGVNAERFAEQSQNPNVLDAMCASETTEDYWKVILNTPINWEAYRAQTYIEEYIKKTTTQESNVVKALFGYRLWPVTVMNGYLSSQLKQIPELRASLNLDNLLE